MLQVSGADARVEKARDLSLDAMLSEATRLGEAPVRSETNSTWHGTRVLITKNTSIKVVALVMSPCQPGTSKVRPENSPSKNHSRRSSDVNLSTLPSAFGRRAALLNHMAMVPYASHSLVLSGDFSFWENTRFAASWNCLFNSTKVSAWILDCTYQGTAQMHDLANKMWTNDHRVQTMGDINTC